MTVASTIAKPTEDNSASADQADFSPGGAMRGETLTQRSELVKRQHNLAEHPAHPSALRLLPGGLDVGAKPGLERVGAPGGHVLVVHVPELTIEVRADVAGELHGRLGDRARCAADLVLRRD